MEESGQLHAPVTNRIEGWGGPRAGLGTVAKGKIPIIAPARKWNPVVQPIAQSLYNWATSALILIVLMK
jgi:hypothetical protein